MTLDEALEVSELLHAYKRLWIETQVATRMRERPEYDSTVIRERVFELAESHIQPVGESLVDHQLRQGTIGTLVRALQHPQL